MFHWLWHFKYTRTTSRMRALHHNGQEVESRQDPDGRAAAPQWEPQEAQGKGKAEDHVGGYGVWQNGSLVQESELTVRFTSQRCSVFNGGRVCTESYWTADGCYTHAPWERIEAPSTMQEISSERDRFSQEHGACCRAQARCSLYPFEEDSNTEMHRGNERVI